MQNSMIWKYLNTHDVPRPGRYTVRVGGSYYQSPGGQYRRVEAAPLRITLTAEDIREWRRPLQESLSNTRRGLKRKKAPFLR